MKKSMFLFGGYKKNTIFALRYDNVTQLNII